MARRSIKNRRSRNPVNLTEHLGASEEALAQYRARASGEMQAGHSSLFGSHSSTDPEGTLLLEQTLDTYPRKAQGAARVSMQVSLGRRIVAAMSAQRHSAGKVLPGDPAAFSGRATEERRDCDIGFADERFGCMTSCKCRWYERCYPYHTLPDGWTGADRDNGHVSSSGEDDIDVGNCGLSVGTLMVLSTTMFSIAVAVVVFLRVCLIVMDEDACEELMKTKPERISNSYPVP